MCCGLPSELNLDRKPTNADCGEYQNGDKKTYGHFEPTMLSYVLPNQRIFRLTMDGSSQCSNVVEKPRITNRQMLFAFRPTKVAMKGFVLKQFAERCRQCSRSCPVEVLAF